MDRKNAFTIKIENWSNAELWQLLSSEENESCLFDQPQKLGDGVFWFKNAPKELFKYAADFTWLSGTSGLYLGTDPLDVYNYKVITEEGEVLLPDFSLITDIAPPFEFVD